MPTLHDIQQLISKHCGVPIAEVTERCDIFNDLGCTGDDFDELMQTYAQTFNVNMDNYLWYFHTDEEGSSIGATIFKPPNARVDRIPVTPKMLLYFANKGFWDITYPGHKLPRWRLDVVVNFLMIIAFVLYAVHSCNK